MTDASETWPTRADLHSEHLQLLADHRETMTRLRNTREELHGTHARLVEVDNQLQAAIDEMRQFRSQATAESTALRTRLATFEQHATANLASLNELAAELTAEVARLAGKDEDPAFAQMTVGVLRALTFNLGYRFRGEYAPGDWDSDVEYARLAGETEADRPAWHDGWTFASRDGDGNLILRYEPSGGLYRVLPIEET